jgi:hypothetical protein
VSAARIKKEDVMDFKNRISPLAAAASVMALAFFIILGNGCGAVQVRGPNPFEADPACTIYADMGIDPATSTGVIPQYIKNPCAAQNIIVSVARSGAILEAYQVEHVRTFVAEAKTYITVGKDVGGIKLYIGMQVGKLNRKFGLLFFTVSDLLIVLPDVSLLQPDDIKLAHASLDNMLAKVEEIAGMLGYVPADLLRAELGKMPSI